MTLQTTILADEIRVLLSTSAFAEEVEYHSIEGGTRTVRMVIEEADDFSDGESTAGTDEEIVGYCLRTRETTDSGTTYYGINNPLVGDFIIRPAAMDASGQPYAFTGVIEDMERYAWSPRWRRRRTVQAGTQNRMPK